MLRATTLLTAVAMAVTGLAMVTPAGASASGEAEVGRPVDGSRAFDELWLDIEPLAPGAGATVVEEPPPDLPGVDGADREAADTATPARSAAGRDDARGRRTADDLTAELIAVVVVLNIVVAIIAVVAARRDGSCPRADVDRRRVPDELVT